MEFNYNRYLPPFLSYIDAYDSGDTLYAEVTRRHTNYEARNSALLDHSRDALLAVSSILRTSSFFVLQARPIPSTVEEALELRDEAVRLVTASMRDKNKQSQSCVQFIMQRIDASGCDHFIRAVVGAHVLSLAIRGIVSSCRPYRTHPMLATGTGFDRELYKAPLKPLELAVSRVASYKCDLKAMPLAPLMPSYDLAFVTWIAVHVVRNITLASKGRVSSLTDPSLVTGIRTLIEIAVERLWTLRTMRDAQEYFDSRGVTNSATETVLCAVDMAEVATVTMLPFFRSRHTTATVASMMSSTFAVHAASGFKDIPVKDLRRLYEEALCGDAHHTKLAAHNRSRISERLSHIEEREKDAAEAQAEYTLASANATIAGLRNKLTEVRAENAEWEQKHAALRMRCVSLQAQVEDAAALKKQLHQTQKKLRTLETWLSQQTEDEIDIEADVSRPILVAPPTNGHGITLAPELQNAPLERQFKVAVVGLLPAQQNAMAAAMRDKGWDIDFTFLESGLRLPKSRMKHFATYDVVVAMVGFINHSTFWAIVECSDNVVSVNGGVSSAVRRLCAALWETEVDEVAVS